MTARLVDTPVLTTERLTLRAPEMKDLEALTRFVESERAEFVRPSADEVSIPWRALTQMTGMWALRGYGGFVLCLKGTDEGIGFVGPWHPSHWPEREIGWSMWSADVEGKGYAREAAIAARAYAYETLGWDTAVSYIDPANTRSIQLATALGCSLDTTATGPDDDCLVYRHPTPEGVPA